MAADPRLRASDKDRERAASQLGESHARGRIDAEEFAERLDKVFEAKTIAELDELTADLPPVDLYPLPAASLPRDRSRYRALPADDVLGRVEAGVSRLPSVAWPAAWGSWLVVTLVCTVLLLVSGNWWPLAWTAAVGAAMACGWAVRRARRSGGGSGGGSGPPGEPPGQIGPVGGA